jgi:hypothetical protein
MYNRTISSNKNKETVNEYDAQSESLSRNDDYDLAYKIKHNNNINNNNNYQNNSDIYNLDLADGLKSLLVNYNFNSELLLNITPSDLSATLGIDLDVATIIITSVVRQKKCNDEITRP